jgi:hypothetical protein
MQYTGKGCGGKRASTPAIQINCTQEPQTLCGLNTQLQLRWISAALSVSIRDVQLNRKAESAGQR